MKEDLIVFSPARDTGTPVESSPKREWFKKGDLVRINQHNKDDAYTHLILVCNSKSCQSRLDGFILKK